MKISFFLTRPDVQTETSIYARICYSGYKFKFYTTESIYPKFWNKETQRAKESQKFKEFPEFNTRLNNIETVIKNVHRRFLNDNNGTVPNPHTLKELLNKEINKREAGQENIKTFFGFFQDVIDQSRRGARINPKTGKAIGRNTFKTYITVFNHLKEFEAAKKKKIGFASITLDFYQDYTEYLMKGKPKLLTNTVGKHIQVIKLILNEATEKGINTNLAFKSRRFATLQEKSDSIYLTEREIKEIENLDLVNNSRLEKVRDLFLIGCYTGLRYSDYSILKPEQIKDGFIETTQVKTGEPVVIPIHRTVEKIIEKYKGKLPHSISNQKTNTYLKELGKLASSLNATTSKTFTKGGAKVVKNFEKWELLTTHTARRSFATNEFLEGTPTLTIMAITGHKTEKAFLRYIKVTPNEHAKLLKSHWDKRNLLRAV